MNNYSASQILNDTLIRYEENISEQHEAVSVLFLEDIYDNKSFINHSILDCGEYAVDIGGIKGYGITPAKALFNCIRLMSDTIDNFSNLLDK